MSETLVQTMRLRWYVAVANYPPRLQQLFHTPGGTPKWIDVPLVYNPDIPLEGAAFTTRETA